MLRKLWHRRALCSVRCFKTGFIKRNKTWDTSSTARPPQRCGGVDREALPVDSSTAEMVEGHHHDGDPVMAGGTRIVHVVQAHLCACGIGAAQLGHDLPRRAEGPCPRPSCRPPGPRRWPGRGRGENLHGAVDLEAISVESPVMSMMLRWGVSTRDGTRAEWGSVAEPCWNALVASSIKYRRDWGTDERPPGTCDPGRPRCPSMGRHSASARSG